MNTVMKKGVTMSKKLIEFDYVDAKGKHSHRVVYPISQPGDKYFVLDLSEFGEEEREFLQESLDQIHSVYMEEIRQLGLGHNYRYFKEDGISNVQEKT